MGPQEMYLNVVTGHAHQRLVRLSVWHERLDGTSDLIYDYTNMNGGTPDHGDILALTVSVSGYEAVHFDAFDHYLTGGNGNGSQASFLTRPQGVFAPFSHDATENPPPTDAPEPGSMALVGLGLGVAAFTGRRKKS